MRLCAVSNRRTQSIKIQRVLRKPTGLTRHWRAGDTDAFDELIVDEYDQHNPLAGNGLQAVKDFFAPVGPVDVQVHRVIAEGARS
jgi:predicted SnoaL-like aldol condensation-catalyzing enzyme